MYPLTPIHNIFPILIYGPILIRTYLPLCTIGIGIYNYTTNIPTPLPTSPQSMGIHTYII